MPEKKTDSKTSWFRQLRAGLDKSRNKIAGAITSTFLKRKLDKDAIEQLEDILIQGDLGVTMASKLSSALKRERFDTEVSEVEIREVLASEIESILSPVALPFEIQSINSPHVILVCGVNGAGKTTTIGKLAIKLCSNGKTVALAAADTFRAAAVDQLAVWAERSGCSIISGKPGADAAGLVFDALKKTRTDGIDVLIIDTAGRLQNRTDLMDELEKIIRVLKKIDKNAPHDTILVMDATIGQNAMSQVTSFKKSVDVSGLILTKLDGSAKGGILVALSEKFNLPVHAVGVGEKIEDLNPFNARDFSRSLLGLDS